MLCYKDQCYCVNEDCKRKCQIFVTDDLIKKAAEAGLHLQVNNFDCEVRDE